MEGEKTGERVDGLAYLELWISGEMCVDEYEGLGMWDVVKHHHDAHIVLQHQDRRM